MMQASRSKASPGIDVLAREFLVVFPLHAIDRVKLGENDAPNFDVTVVFDIVG
jgi:hypothetical protein